VLALSYATADKKPVNPTAYPPTGRTYANGTYGTEIDLTTASYIWEQCDGLHTAGQIAQGLAEACDVDVQTAAHNVAETIRQLAKLNLLESCEG
jgi:hypothetical protein